MNEQMIGANLAEMAALAQQFTQASARLDTIAGQVSNGVKISAWVGPFAANFKLSWDSEHGVRLRAAAHALAEQARIINQNAAEQRAASGSLAGGAGGVVLDHGAFRHPSGSVESGGNPLNALGLAGGIQTVTELSTLGGSLPKAFAATGGVLTVIGIVGGIATVVEGSNEADIGKIGSGSVDVTLGAATIATGAAGLPILGPIGVGKWLIDSTIPYTKESQDGLLDWKARKSFGAPLDQLSSEQAQALQKYYAGSGSTNDSDNPLLGSVRVISDKMDETYDEAVNMVTSAAQPGINWIGDKTGWF